MFKRAKETNCLEEFLKLSRNKNDICATRDFDYKTQRYKEYKLEESTLNIASGQHELRYIKMNGRLQVDLYNYYRRESNLTSYKLDYVAGHFIGDFVKKIDKDTANNTSTIQSSNLTGLLVGSFIHLEEIGHSVEYYESGAKFIVQSIDKDTKSFVIEGVVNPDEKKKTRWCLAKDDVTPKDIFRLTNGTSADRAIVAKYCIQDCNLVHYLFNKSDVLTGFIEMSKICSVPINFLVMRGQGIKLTSYIAKKCREKKTLMPVIEKGSLNDGYEGAIVLEPKCDLYLDNPVACVDYASLYPSSMISENLSHDSKVWTKEYDLDGNLIKETGDKDKHGNYIYDNLEKYEYVDITYDTYKYVRKTPSSAAEKVKCGTKTCRFAQFKDGKAIMPSILEELLKARKSTRKLIPNEKDDFMKQVLEQRQLGYKLTANSLYGQCGAKTSTFYEKDIAACTTATGRKLLTYARRVIEETYGNKICDTKDYGKVMSKAEYIYGDTDSVFFTFNLETLDGKPIRGKKALEITIELAQEAGEVASSFLKKPHDLEYEKTFMPFCLLSKKRYVGMLYEIDPNKGKRKEMGIVLKRRDNAPIVKDIYGGIIDILMKEQNISKAVEYLRFCLQNMVDEKYPIEKLIITKSLRGYYKNPKSIAHKVLADRIAEREPGNKPSSGDRIPYVYINTKNAKALQGEKIETPVFIRENNINIDYSFYISNQIMKPVSQVFSLVLEKIWKDSKKIGKIKKFNSDIKNLRMTCDESKFDSKLEQLKTKEVKALLFDNYLRVTNNKKQGNTSIKDMFIKMNKK
jgi:DNA polymerase elongation subunit (family B)